jgi:hypothetical protein
MTHPATVRGVPGLAILRDACHPKDPKEKRRLPLRQVPFRLRVRQNPGGRNPAAQCAAQPRHMLIFGLNRGFAKISLRMLGEVVRVSLVPFAIVKGLRVIGLIVVRESRFCVNCGCSLIPDWDSTTLDALLLSIAAVATSAVVIPEVTKQVMAKALGQVNIANLHWL